MARRPLDLALSLVAVLATCLALAARADARSKDVQARAGTDADGVSDALARCPGSIAQLCPCAGPRASGLWKNHGAYVSCVAHATEAFERAHLLSERQEDLVVKTAAQSSCGRRPI